LQAGALLAFFGALNSVQIGALLGAERFALLALSNTLRSLLGLVAIVAGSFCGGLTGALIALAAAELLAFLANQYLIHRTWAKLAHAPRSTPITKSDMLALLSFSLPALLSSISTQPAIWLSNSLLARQPNGLEALAVFMAADRWRQLLLFLPSSLSANTLPLLAHLHGVQDGGGFRRVLKLNSVLNTIAIVLPVAVTLLFARQFMLVFGAAYGAGGPTLGVLAISAIFMVINNMLGQGIVGMGLIWLRLVLDVGLGLVLLTCAFLFIPAYQELGLALAWLAAYAAAGSLLVAATARRLFSAVPAKSSLESR
jgi:O-antigen/teichoic acid export membrane protein